MKNPYENKKKSVFFEIRMLIPYGFKNLYWYGQIRVSGNTGFTGYIANLSLTHSTSIYLNNLSIYLFLYIKYSDIFLPIYQTYRYTLNNISIDRYIPFDLPSVAVATIQSYITHCRWFEWFEKGQMIFTVCVKHLFFEFFGARITFYPTVGCRVTKINIPFFMGNEIFNIFHRIIFSKRATFLEKTAKKIVVETWTFFVR